MSILRNSRRSFFYLCSAAATSRGVTLAALSRPTLKRIKMVTVGVHDIESFFRQYSRWLGYKLVDKGVVCEALSLSWSMHDAFNKPYIVLCPESGADVYIRAIETQSSINLKPFRHGGWVAIEILVSDLDLVYQKLKGAPFAIIAPPKSIVAGSPIRAMQVMGLAGEVLYLTESGGDRAALNHPEPKSLVDRIFIVVLAGGSAESIEHYYSSVFNLNLQGNYQFSIDLLSNAHGLPDNHVYNFSVLSGSEIGNKIEIDEYPEKFAKPMETGSSIPSGFFMVTFETDFITRSGIDFVSPPAMLYQNLYAGTIIGPVGEKIEVVSDTFI